MCPACPRSNLVAYVYYINSHAARYTQVQVSIPIHLDRDTISLGESLVYALIGINWLNSNSGEMSHVPLYTWPSPVRLAVGGGIVGNDVSAGVTPAGEVTHRSRRLVELGLLPKRVHVYRPTTNMCNPNEPPTPRCIDKYIRKHEMRPHRTNSETIECNTYHALLSSVFKKNGNINSFMRLMFQCLWCETNSRQLLLHFKSFFPAKKAVWKSGLYHYSERFPKHGDHCPALIWD